MQVTNTTVSIGSVTAYIWGYITNQCIWGYMTDHCTGAYQAVLTFTDITVVCTAALPLLLSDSMHAGCKTCSVVDVIHAMWALHCEPKWR